MKFWFALLVFMVACLHGRGQDSSQFQPAQTGDTIIVKNYKLGENVITFYTTCYHNCDTLVSFVNVHDDENTSVEAANELLTETGGSLMQLQHTGDRYLHFRIGQTDFAVDPNRIYSVSGIKASLLKQGKYSKLAAAYVKAFADTLLQNFVARKKLVIALHNNTEGNLSIHSYGKGQSEGSNGAKVYINPSADPDDFILTTTEDIFNIIKAKKINVVLQAKNAKDDGSLSIYAKNKKIPYINVEAQHGHVLQQLAMLKALQEIIQRYQSYTPL